jgi:hypothetical protein
MLVTRSRSTAVVYSLHVGVHGRIDVREQETPDGRFKSPGRQKALHARSASPLCMGTNTRSAAQIRGTRPFSRPSFSQARAVCVCCRRRRGCARWTGQAGPRGIAAQICCPPIREGPRRVRLALAAGLWRRAAGDLGLGGASVGRGRGVEAVASTSILAENFTATVSPEANKALTHS